MTLGNKYDNFYYHYQGDMVIMGIKTIGVIGCGNMGSAIVRGLTSGIYANGIRILINDALAEKSVALAEDSNSEVSELQELVKMSDIVIIAIKPQDSQAVFERIEAHITARKLVISVMAGVKISEISKGVGRDVPIVRAMPNMPGIIGAGITCLSYNSLVRDQEMVNNILNSNNDNKKFLLEIKKSETILLANPVSSEYDTVRIRFLEELERLLK